MVKPNLLLQVKPPKLILHFQNFGPPTIVSCPKFRPCSSCPRTHKISAPCNSFPRNYESQRERFLHTCKLQERDRREKIRPSTLSFFVHLVLRSLAKKLSLERNVNCPNEELKLPFYSTQPKVNGPVSWPRPTCHFWSQKFKFTSFESHNGTFTQINFPLT